MPQFWPRASGSATGPDTWYSLMAGRLIWNNGLPHHDSVASMTLGRTWVDQEWLGHLGIYGLLAAGGWALALLTGVVGYTAAFAVSAVGARVRGGSERAVALVVLVAFVTSGSNTELRAQTFAYVLFALTLLLLLGDDRAPSRRVYLTLPLLVLWANVHGSVLLGAAVVALYGAISAVRAARRLRPGHWLPRAVGLILLPWAARSPRHTASRLPVTTVPSRVFAIRRRPPDAMGTEQHRQKRPPPALHPRRG